MSIDLKAHGLRVKPLEWCKEGDYRRVAYVGDVRMGTIEYVPAVEEWKIRDGSPDDFYADEVAAETACQKRFETRVLALLEQVEGGQ